MTKWRESFYKTQKERLTKLLLSKKHMKIGLQIKGKFMYCISIKI